MNNSKVQEACLRLLHRLIALEDVDGRRIGERFCRDKHPELYTNTYLPSLDEVRQQLLDGRFKTAETFYVKTVRSIKGVCSTLPRQDQRYKDGKSLYSYLVYLWMADVHLPLFDTVLALFDTNITPAPLPSDSVTLARSRGGLIGPYFQLLATLVQAKDKSKASIGQSFYLLPLYDEIHPFAKLIKDPLSLKKIESRVIDDRYHNPESLYNDCREVYENFERAWPRTSSKWRDALYMKTILPKIWSIIPGLPVMSPVRTWQYVQAVKVSMGKVDESHAILADEASTAPIRELPVPSAHVMPVLTTTFNGPTVDVSVGQATQASTSRQPVQQTAEQFAEPMSAAGVSTQVPPNMQSVQPPAIKVQTADEIARIVAAPPLLLGRMARVRVLQDLNVISFLHRTDGSNALLPSMTSQPEYLPEDIGPDYTYPGLPYLLDIVFDEQASGIRTNPNQVTSSRINRENWAVHAARKLFKDSKTVPEATLLNAIGRELLSYSIERHDQEIDVEISATRNCLYMLQAALPAQNPSFNLFELFRARTDHFYRIWHRKAMVLLREHNKSATVEPNRLLTMLSQASAVAALLANQIAALEITLKVHSGNISQLAAIFETGITASTVPNRMTAPPLAIPADTPPEPGFDHHPFQLRADSPEVRPLVLSIAKDISLHNRLTPQARDLVLAHIQSSMQSLIADGGVRALLLCFLSFYPEHVGLHITLSSCYSAARQYGVQAHLCRSAGKISVANGPISSEALTNLAVARMNMDDCPQALIELDKACKVNPTNWEALCNIVFLMTRTLGNGPIEARRVDHARAYCFTMLQCIWGLDVSLQDGVPSSGRARIPPQIPVRDIHKFQALYMTMGALATEAGQPHLALLDYVHGIEVSLTGPAEPNREGTSGGSDERKTMYTIAELMQAINFHVQYLWLKHSTSQDQVFKCHQTLLLTTNGQVDSTAVGKNTLKFLRQNPNILKSKAVPHSSRFPVLLLLPGHINDLARSVLQMGQSNDLIIPPITLAEGVNLEWRRLADRDAVSVLADICIALCQIIEMSLSTSNMSLHTAIQNSLGIPPSLACLINLYYFSISLKPQASAMHNLALLYAQIDRNYPATRLTGPENEKTYHTPMDYACLWTHEASQARPRGTVSAEAVQAMHQLRLTRAAAANAAQPAAIARNTVSTETAEPSTSS